MKIKTEIHNPIGMIINVETYIGEKLRGEILDWIPAGVAPTVSDMKRFYGNGWENKTCKGAYRPLRNHRVLFVNEYNGHHIVQPLVEHSAYYDIWLEDK